jgi:hypothetical protein
MCMGTYKMQSRMGVWVCASFALLAGCSGKRLDLGEANQSQADGGGTGGVTGKTGLEGGSAAAPGEGGVVTPGMAVPPPVKGITKSSKLDLLLVVDNSISMADKQQVLKETIPDLVNRLTDPASGVKDLHVGVITSSIGGHGSTLCQGSDTSGKLSDEEQNDHAHLVTTRPRYATIRQAFPGAQAPEPAGYMAWDSTKDPTALAGGIQSMVIGASEFGCGLESQLEAMYRFLVDPSPPQVIAEQPCDTHPADKCAVPVGRDDALLAQRAAFLRPDSAVAIVQLTDENDCSIRESDQYYYAARDNITLPHSSSACVTNPNDPCCYSCATKAPAGCKADPSCSTPANPNLDQLNLRCFDQKRRFGLDFLYPVTRYVNALTQQRLCTSRPDLDPDPANCPDLNNDHQPDIAVNPLVPGTADARDPSMVYLLGIVGVPWQDLAAASDGTTLRYKTPAELSQSGTWDVILGNRAPGNGAPPVLPADSLMIESINPRGGMDGESPPVALAGPDSQQMANPVNGHEWRNMNQDDLEYACIFPLATPRDCAAVAKMADPQPGCDCKLVNPGDDNPLCQNPSTGAYETTQHNAKAYPGLRELEVLKGMGGRGLVSSICARNLTDKTSADYGYRPAIDTLITQLKQSVR